MKIRADEESEETYNDINAVGRVIYFFTGVNLASVSQLIRYIDNLESKSKAPISILMSSGGGLCNSGLAAYDRIRRSKCEITTIATGLVGSMGLIIFLAGDRRYMTENAVLLNHQPEDHETGGRVSFLRNEFVELDRIQSRMVGIISEATGLSEKRLRDDVKEGNYYITPDQAVKEGYIDQIVRNQPRIKK